MSLLESLRVIRAAFRAYRRGFDDDGEWPISRGNQQKKNFCHHHAPEEVFACQALTTSDKNRTKRLKL